MSTETLDRKLNIPHIIVTFFIASVMYVIFASVCGITPFGSGSWLAYDIKRQSVDFYAYYKSILCGNNNLFYSFDMALGSGALGFFVYYLTSPFIILTMFFPARLLPCALTLVIGLKLATASVTCDIMLQKICGKSAYICAIAYAFGAYMFSDVINLMWLDVLIMLPLLIMYTEKLLHKGQLLGYVICVALSIYLSYYMSYFILLFILCWAVIRLFAVKSRYFAECIFRLCIATGAGIGLDAFFLLPTILEIRDNMGENALAYLSNETAGTTPLTILSNIFSLSYDPSEILNGDPQLFIGMILLTLAVMYFFNKKIEAREKLSFAILLTIVIASFGLDIPNRILVTGVVIDDCPYREAAASGIVLVICACRSMQEFKEGMSTGRVMAGSIPVTAVTVYIYLTRVNARNGMLNASLVTACILLTLMSVAIRKAMGAYIAVGLIFVIELADLGMNGVYIYKTQSVLNESLIDYTDKVTDINDAVSAVKSRDMTVYRMENLSPRQQNDSMMQDYMGITHYSIATPSYVRRFLQRMGYNDNLLYTDYGGDNTETADSVLGIRYLLSDSDPDRTIHPDYSKLYDLEYDVYRNPYALPLAMGVYREMSGDAPDPFSMQEDIYSRLVGEQTDIFIPADVQMIESDNSHPVREYRVIAKEAGEMYFYMSDLTDMTCNLEILLNNEPIAGYGNSGCLKVLNLGYYEKNDYFIFHVMADDTGEFGTALFVTEDREALKEAYQKTVARHADVKRVGGSNLMITLDSSYTVGDNISGEVGVFTTIPYQKGWRVKVAGVRVEPVEIYDSLMYIPVTEALQQVELGPSEDIRIELKYVPEGLYPGLIASALTVLVMILAAMTRKSEAGFFGDDQEEEEWLNE